MALRQIFNPFTRDFQYISVEDTDIGMPSGGNAGEVLSKIDSTDYNTQWSDLSNYQQKSNLGWVQYSDDQYTSSSPLAITSGTRTKLTNNGANILNIVNMLNASTIWDTANNKFNPDNSGDTYDWRVQFTANSSVNNRNLTIELDIGGAQEVIWDKTIRLARGAGVDTRVTEQLDIYTLSTFIANGGELYLTCDGNIDIFDIVFKIERKFRA